MPVVASGIDHPFVPTVAAFEGARTIGSFSAIEDLAQLTTAMQTDGLVVTKLTSELHQQRQHSPFGLAWQCDVQRWLLRGDGVVAWEIHGI